MSIFEVLFISLFTIIIIAPPLSIIFSKLFKANESNKILIDLLLEDYIKRNGSKK